MREIDLLAAIVSAPLAELVVEVHVPEYSTYIGPGRFAESPFQCRRSNAGGVSPFR
jgi:hypothetical protein